MRGKDQAVLAIVAIRYRLGRVCGVCHTKRWFVVSQHNLRGVHAWVVEAHCNCGVKIFKDAP